MVAAQQENRFPPPCGNGWHRAEPAFGPAVGRPLRRPRVAALAAGGALAAGLLGGWLAHGQQATAVLKVVGSATVAQAVGPAAQILRGEMSLPVLISTHGGSTAGIEAVGEGRAELGMLSRPLAASERAAFPQANLKEIYLGEHVLALVVARDVWEGGIRSLSRDRMQGIYEGQITNWRQIGGPDLPVNFFNPVAGEGTWEIFADWLYGDTRRAPVRDFKVVENHEVARAAVDFTAGAITVIPPSLANGERSFAVALVDDYGLIVLPTPRNVANGRYPLHRPLVLLSNDRPVGSARILADLLLGERGQKMLGELGMLPVETVRAAGGNRYAPLPQGPAAPKP